MYTMLEVDAEYVVIHRDHQHALLLKMDLDAEAPNILGMDQHCTPTGLQPPGDIILHGPASGDRLRVTQIRSVSKDWAIPMCTRRNAVHWHESSLPNMQAVVVEACVTKRADRTIRFAFSRAINGGKLRTRQRFFDPFEKRERNLPGNTATDNVGFCCLVRATFAKIPAGSRLHSRIKYHVPAEYAGKLTHYGPAGEDSYFATTQQLMYDPMSNTAVPDKEQIELANLLYSSQVSSEDETIMDLLTAATALVKCCADKEWRQADHPSSLSVEQCLRIIQKYAYPDLEQPKYGNLAKLLKRVLLRLLRMGEKDDANLIVPKPKPDNKREMESGCSHAANSRGCHYRGAYI